MTRSTISEVLLVFFTGALLLAAGCGAEQRATDAAGGGPLDAIASASTMRLSAAVRDPPRADRNRPRRPSTSIVVRGAAARCATSGIKRMTPATTTSTLETCHRAPLRRR